MNKKWWEFVVATLEGDEINHLIFCDEQMAEKIFNAIECVVEPETYVAYSLSDSEEWQPLDYTLVEVVKTFVLISDGQKKSPVGSGTIIMAAVQKWEFAEPNLIAGVGLVKRLEKLQPLKFVEVSALRRAKRLYWKDVVK